MTPTIASNTLKIEQSTIQTGTHVQHTSTHVQVCIVDSSRVQVHFKIDRILDEKFREFVSKKWNKHTGGLLSHEFENAIKHYLSSGGFFDTHTQKHKSKNLERIDPYPKLADLVARIKKYLIDNALAEDFEPKYITTRHLKDAIAAIKGNDKRTVDKWLRQLADTKHLLPRGLAQWEFPN